VHPVGGQLTQERLQRLLDVGTELVGAGDTSTGKGLCDEEQVHIRFRPGGSAPQGAKDGEGDQAAAVISPTGLQ